MFQTQKNAVGVFIILVLNDQGNITPFCLDIKRLQKVEKKCSDTTLDLSRTLASALVLPAKKKSHFSRKAEDCLDGHPLPSPCLRLFARSPALSVAGRPTTSAVVAFAATTTIALPAGVDGGVDGGNNEGQN